MKILYDHQMFSIQKYGGVTKYFCELIKHIPLQHQHEIAVLFSDNQYLKEDKDFFKKANIPIPEVTFRGKRFLKNKIYNINQFYSKRVIAANKFDLLHPTFYDTYFFDYLKKPYVITVHDFIEFKDEFYKESTRRKQMEKVIKNANRIIAISENTKKDLIDILAVNPEKIDVVHHGFNRPVKTSTNNKHGEYILFVGRRANYKNFKIFIKAAAILLNKEKDLKLICVGEPFSRDEIEAIKSLGILKQTIQMGVDNNGLDELYSHALVFVYPSLYEGFGMPILEAFANDCPVCLSNASSFPEIAGDAAVYFDPYNHLSILEAMENIIYDSALAQKIVRLGNERLNNFSWDKCALQTTATYNLAI